jgi:hypothetical protein
MIPRNQQNRKLQMNMACPTCGMDLTDPKTRGFVLRNETYCCEGCATGTGCTCNVRASAPKKAGNRPGDLGQRNRENSARDKNQDELDTSGRFVGKKLRTTGTPRKRQSHEKVDASGQKLSRSLAKERSSTREESRGRSEFRGALNSRRTDRVGRTGTKSR